MPQGRHDDAAWGSVLLFPVMAYAVSTFSSRSDRPSPVAVALAVLLHALVILTLWGLSIYQPQAAGPTHRAGPAPARSHHGGPPDPGAAPCAAAESAAHAAAADAPGAVARAIAPAAAAPAGPAAAAEAA
jgi:hypothetical protein